MPIKLKDVAREAGVSVSIASLALNDHYEIKIASSTRQRIKKAAKKLGYRGSSLARSLRLQKTDTLGIIVPTLTTPFYDEIARGIEQIASQRGYTITIGSANSNPQKERDHLNSMKDKRVDGILASTFDKSNFNSYNEIKGEVPIVFVDSYLPEVDSDYVICDNSKGAYLATKNLINLDCQNILYLSHGNTKVLVDRYEGYKKALEENNIKVKNEFIFEGIPEDSIKEILNSQKIDGMFLASNDVMMKVLKILKNKEMKVPEDIRISGFDDPLLKIERKEDLELINLIQEPIPAVIQPRRKMGEKGCQILIDRIEGKIGNNKRERIILPCLLKNIPPVPSRDKKSILSQFIGQRRAVRNEI